MSLKYKSASELLHSSHQRLRGNGLSKRFWYKPYPLLGVPTAISPGYPGKKSTSRAWNGSYLRPIDSCITQLKAQEPSRTCNESKEEGMAPVRFVRQNLLPGRLEAVYPPHEKHPPALRAPPECPGRGFGCGRKVCTAAVERIRHI